jgi:hypothetical protein
VSVAQKCELGPQNMKIDGQKIQNAVAKILAFASSPTNASFF